MAERKRSRGWLTAAVLVLLAVLGASRSLRAQQVDGDPSAQDAATDSDANDPPSQVARLAVLNGNVSYEPASVNEFAAAEMNYPLTTGDRLYTDVNSNAELQTDTLAVRMGAQTDLTVTGMTDVLSQFGLAQGAVHLRSFSLDPSATVEMDTPNVAVTVLQPGDVRVDVDPSGDVTVVTVLGGQVQVNGNGMQLTMQTGEAMQFSGGDPVSAQGVAPAQQDALDVFSADRDSLYQSDLANESNDVNGDTIGAEDLAQNGDWQNDADAGPVWYPSGVAVDWEPYRYGHWVWIAPWGWTWVENEPWGFAPFHYGRWGRFGGRWGWVPGPRVVRPVWSPALVVFVGAPGVAAWFPLGPREPFVPWYHAGTLYLNRVNVSNLSNSNNAQVRSAYGERTTNLYAGEEGAHRVYANRQIATVAMPQTAFAAGKPVAANALRGQQPQLATAPLIGHPAVVPQRSMVVSAPAKALPPHVARPPLASRVNEEAPAVPTNPERPAVPIARPPPPVTRQPAPVQTPNPTRGAPPQQTNPGSTTARPGQSTTSPAPVQTPNPMRGAPPMQLNPGSAPQRPTQPAPVQAPNPTRGEAPVHDNVLPSPQPAEPVNSAPQRPLYNRTEPPAPRPSFQQQQETMQQSEPGRPLTPQQTQSLPQPARQQPPAQQPPPQRQQPAPQQPQRQQPQPQRQAAPAPATDPNKRK